MYHAWNEISAGVVTVSEFFSEVAYTFLHAICVRNRNEILINIRSLVSRYEHSYIPSFILSWTNFQAQQQKTLYVPVF